MLYIVARDFISKNRETSSLPDLLNNVGTNYIIALIKSFCDLGDKYVTFLALAWYRWSCNTVSLSANNFIKARKLPGFFSESPRRE